MTSPDSSTIEIRQAGECDLDVLVPLFDAYRVFYERESDPQLAREFLGQRIQRGEAIVYLAYAREDTLDKAAGFTLLYPLFSSVSAKRLWLLNDLYVEPAYRKRGVGWKLLERARQLAEESGARGVELNTAHTNTTAQRLYEGFGYRRDETFRKYIFDL